MIKQDQPELAVQEPIGTVQIKTNTNTIQLPFFEGCNTIGRNPNKNIIHINDPTVSEIQCVVRITKESCFVMDFGSFNGTFIGSFQKSVIPHREIKIDLQKEILFVSEVECKFVFNPSWTEPYAKQKCQEVGVQTIKGYQNQLEKPKEEQDSRRQATMLKPSDKENIIDKKKTPQQKTRKLQHAEQQSAEESNTLNSDLKMKQCDSQQETGERPDGRIIIRRKNRSNQIPYKQYRKTFVPKNARKLPQIHQYQQSDLEKQRMKTKINKQSNKKRTKSTKSTLTNTNRLSSRSREQSQDQDQLQSLYLQLNKNRRVRLLFSACSIPQNHNLEIKRVNDNEDFDVLVMQSYSRTYKLMMAILMGKPIVSMVWLQDSQKIGKLYNIMDYLIQIPQSPEAQYRSSRILRKSLDKVKSGFRVFKDINICLFCNDYSLKTSLLQRLINLGGGCCVSRRQMENAMCVISKASIVDDELSQRSWLKKQCVYSEEMIYDACVYQNLDLEKYKME